MHRKKYDAEYKLRVVQEAIQTRNSSAVARRYEVAPTMVARWLRNYKAHGAAAFDRTRKQPTHSDLDQQLHQFELENEQLKRLLGEKDLEIAILRDLVKKGTHR